MTVLSNSDNLFVFIFTLGSQLDSSLCCCSCAGIFSTSAIATQCMLTEVILLASLHCYVQCQNQNPLKLSTVNRVRGLNQGVCFFFFLTLVYEQTEHGRADFCKTAILSVAGAFMCCCDTNCINFSFQYLPCFLKNEKFQSALNLIANDVIYSPGQCDLAICYLK